MTRGAAALVGALATMAPTGQTLTPRWFVAARHEGTSAPVRTGSPALRAQPRRKAVDTTLGFRVTPEITIRGSYYRRLFYGRATRGHSGRRPADVVAPVVVGATL